jgi:ERF superfamily
MKNNKEVAVIAPPQSSVDTFISQALAANAPVETLERLFALHRDVQAERARAAFTNSLAEFQENCPIIKKTKKVMNKDGQTVRYVYAPIDAIVEQIKKPLAVAGFSYTFTVKNTEDLITATAKVTHKLGHFETSTFSIPVDKEGYMTAPQKIASALTFAKRYALCNALGISTGDEDTDATDVGKEPDVKSLKSKVIFLLRNLGEKVGTGVEIAVEIERLTGLKLVDANLSQIVEKLEAKVIAKNHEEPTIQQPRRVARRTQRSHHWQ